LLQSRRQQDSGSAAITADRCHHHIRIEDHSNHEGTIISQAISCPFGVGMSDCPCERMGSPLRPVPFRVSLRQHSLPMVANDSDRTKGANQANWRFWNELAKVG
jgi:hypothetical protein